jgi:hypothetical protein
MKERKKKGGLRNLSLGGLDTVTSCRGEPEGKRPLGRPRSRWVDNIRVNLREVGWEGVDWMHLTQVRDQWLVLMNTFEFHKERVIFDLLSDS